MRSKQDTPARGKSYERRSKLPDRIIENNNQLFAYRQQNKLMDAAARQAIDHVALAKRNRKDNQQRK